MPRLEMETPRAGAPRGAKLTIKLSRNDAAHGAVTKAIDQAALMLRFAQHPLTPAHRGYFARMAAKLLTPVVGGAR